MSFSIRATQMDSLRQFLAEQAFGRLDAVDQAGEPIEEGEQLRYLYLDRKIGKRQQQIAEWTADEVAALGEPDRWIEDAADAMNGPGRYQARVMLADGKHQKHKSFDVTSGTSQRAGAQSADRTLAVAMEELRRSAQSSAERADHQAARGDALASQLLESQERHFDRTLSIVDRSHELTLDFLDRLQGLQMELLEAKIAAANPPGLLGLPAETWAALAPAVGPVLTGAMAAAAPVGGAIADWLRSAAEARRAAAARDTAEAEALRARLRRLQPVPVVAAPVEDDQQEAEEEGEAPPQPAPAD